MTIEEIRVAVKHLDPKLPQAHEDFRIACTLLSSTFLWTFVSWPSSAVPLRSSGGVGCWRGGPMADRYSVPTALASRVTTAAEAVSAAKAVTESRVIVGLMLGRIPAYLDTRLYDLEIAYWKRADALTESRGSAEGSAASARLWKRCAKNYRARWLDARAKWIRLWREQQSNLSDAPSVEGSKA